jgi:hypothetical protein
MKDFTFDIFINLLNVFRETGYKIISFEDYLTSDKEGKILILRHDVDRYPLNTLKMATLEKENGFRATYYFRIIPSVFKPEILKKVYELGHEVSYHYEDLSITKGDFEKAIKHFEESLNKIRKFSPARTICRHGSPLSKWDSKRLWEKYDYKDYGIIGSTCFDVDYDEVFYITDNGWGWNNTSVSVRDKVISKFDIPINNTFHLTDLIKNGMLPDKVMINAHPDTFFDPGLKWTVNMLKIKTKNIIKRQIVKYNLIK